MPGEPAGRGRVDRSQVKHLKQHELDTADRLADLGHDVTFLPRAVIKSADVLIDGVEWELKSPIGALPASILQGLREGRKQARRVLVVLARSPLSWDDAVAAVDAVFERYDGVTEVGATWHAADADRRWLKWPTPTVST